MVGMEQIRLPIPAELLEAVDQARGDVPRTVWIRRAIEERLAAHHQRGFVAAIKRGARAAAPDNAA